MTLKFLGAAQTVTGSRYLLTSGATNVLVDCGLFQGFKHLRLKNWDSLPFAAGDIDAIILTHAHLDHSGALPLMHRQGYRGPIYCTAATRDLCKIMLVDSGFLQEEEARLANKKGYSKHSPAEPLYSEEDALKTLPLLKAVDWRAPVAVGPFQFQFAPAGHLLGAASVHVRAPDGAVLFSGDIGRGTDPVMRAPEAPPGAEFVVMESTYGDRRHIAGNPERELEAIINGTIRQSGTVIIPSFAVGRAQLIMYYIYELKRKRLIPADLPVYLNSPMAKAVNGTFRHHAGEHKLGASLAMEVCSVAEAVSTVEESIAVNADKRPKVIIAASGMASGGRVLHHLKTYGSDPSSSIVFVGFQAPGTRGEALVNGAERIKIHGEYWPIRAEVFQLASLSAHADSDELIQWLRRMPERPRQVFLTHGEAGASEALRLRCKEELGFEPLVPEMMSAHELRGGR